MRLLERCFWLCVLALAGPGAYVAGAQTSNHPRLMAQVASGEVIACAYSTDGRAVLTGGREGKARLWDVATGAELQFFQGEAWIRYVALSSDNRRVLTVSTLDEKTAAQLWDESTGKELGRISPPVGKLIFGLASPDGSTIATASWAETDDQGNKLPAGDTAKIQMWNVETGKELQHFLVPGAAAVGSEAVLSPDGSKLFTGDFDGPRLWDLQTGKLLLRFENHSEVVGAAVFSADGHRVVWGSIQGSVRLWNLETGKEIQHFSADSPQNFMGAVDSVALSPDGRRVLTGSNEGKARVWDVETGKELQRFAASGRVVNVTVNCAAFSPDGRGVLTGSDDQTARLWDVETGKEVRRLVGDADPVAALAFVADGRGIVTVSRTGMAWRLDADGSRTLPLQSPVVPSKGNVPSVAASTAGRAADLLPVTVGDGRYVSPVVLSPDGRRVLLAGFHGEQGVWDVETGREIRSFEWQGTGFATADFSPDGSRMLTASGGLWASLWDVETGKEIQHFTVKPGWRPRVLYPEGDYRAGVEHLAFSPDGRRALTADSEGSTRLWDVKTGRQVRVLKVHTFKSLSVGFSPDGSKMLTENADGTATLRDVKTGNEVQHFGRTSRPSFSVDGSRVLMGLSVWDVATGKELRHFNAPFGTQPVEALSADGRRVLIGSSDGVTKLWDVETGRELASLYCFQDGSWAVVDAEGRFDTDKHEGNVALHWIVDSDPMRLLPLATFKDGHYTPHLLGRIFSGEKLPPVP